MGSHIQKIAPKRIGIIKILPSNSIKPSLTGHLNYIKGNSIVLASGSIKKLCPDYKITLKEYQIYPPINNRLVVAIGFNLSGEFHFGIPDKWKNEVITQAGRKLISILHNNIRSAEIKNISSKYYLEPGKTSIGEEIIIGDKLWDFILSVANLQK